MDDEHVPDFNKMLEDLGNMIGELDNLDEVSNGTGRHYVEQDVMLDSLEADCDDCDDEKPLIPPRAPIVPMQIATPPIPKKPRNTHMWVTLPTKDQAAPSGEVALDGEVLGKYVTIMEDDQDAPQSPGAMTVKVFNEDNSSVTFSVSPKTTASEACHKLVILNGIKEDPNWVIVEHLATTGMERNLEDHEIVIDVYNSLANCSNKLLFRKDLRKYDFFTNTANYFPAHLLDAGNSDGGVTEQARKAKRILLQNLLSKCNRVPEISEVLFTKDFSKKSWSKKFLILRGSGLYSSLKGKSKAFKDLQSFVQFDSTNLYVLLNAIKTHKAPTCFSFCIAPPNPKDPKEIKCFCAHDEKTILSWMIGIRLAKYGAQLRQNYDDMLRKFAKLAKLTTAPASTTSNNVPQIAERKQSVPCEHRVAMDFTGTYGKLMTNGKEIEKLANSRHKPQLSRRMTSSNFVTNSNESEQELSEEDWFHGRISREETLALMRKEGLEDGLFLVRQSSSVTNVFVLSFCMNKKVFHCQLVQDVGPGNTMYCSLDKGPAFPCIAELVRYYQRKTINGISVALRRPCLVKRRRNLSCV